MADEVSYATVEPPAHVPADCLIDFDYFNPPGIEKGDIYASLKPLLEGRDIRWSPRNGGHWIVARHDDVRWVRELDRVFSHEEFQVPRGSMNLLMPPSTVDPPYHARFRAVLNPPFSPGRVRLLTEQARAIAGELADTLKPQGHCDFVAEFARIMPVVVFLGMLGLPIERREEFAAWAVAYTGARDQESKDKAAAEIAAFLSGVLDEREANPGEDLLSRIAAWRRNPRFQREEEVMGMAMVSFIGGLDTLVGLMSFTARHLAEHPEQQRRLRAEPALVPRAAEEIMRRYGLTMTGRVLTADIERKGVTMKRDDMLLVVDAAAAIDERAWPDPLTVDFDRDARLHDTFGNATHKCVGEHLARMEINVFVEEWLKRIPEFRLDPATPPRVYGGPVIGMTQLGLRWD